MISPVAAVKDWLVRAGMRHFDHSRWHIIPFSPILYTAVFLGAVTVLVTPSNNLQTMFGYPLYVLWSVTCMLCVPLLVVARRLVMGGTPRQRYIGLYLRFGLEFCLWLELWAVQIGQIANLFTPQRTDSEPYLFSLFTLAACGIFVGCLVLRDLWVVWVTEMTATQIKNADDGRGDGV